MDGLWRRSATDLARELRDGDVSAREVLDAHLARIEETNPAINAIVTLDPERAIAQAHAADEALARGDAVGPLHGLPIAHKDLVDTAGVRTTYGSPIYADHVPERDEPFVVRVRAAGAIMLGKTNTPEFGAGSHTFNEVFGPTRNPWDLSKSAGGSSGGAAAALAAGMVPIADGSDLGGSLRNPASFCNVVGFRPSLGTVPSWPDADPEDLSVDGPMASHGAGRRVAVVRDGAQARSGGGAGAGGRPRTGCASPGPPPAPARCPSIPRSSTCVDAALPSFERLGCRVEPAYPDLTGRARGVLHAAGAHRSRPTTARCWRITATASRTR